jgi:hypothetical protein
MFPLASINMYWQGGVQRVKVIACALLAAIAGLPTTGPYHNPSHFFCQCK